MLRNVVYRRVPISVSLQTLFGGIFNQFGWIFFSFGMIFVWVFVPEVDFTFVYFWGETTTVTGYVSRVEDTNFSENDRPVINHYYSFRALDGNEYVDNSYTTGMEYAEGTKVEIEYPKGKPEYSRIVGMRREKIGLLVLFVCLFPAIGLIIIIFGIKSGRKISRLLKRGSLTTGKLKSKTRTNTTINEQRVYKLTFSFFDEDKQEHFVSENTHITTKLEDDAEERILYNPTDPKQAVLIDNIPGLPRIEQGAIFPGSLRKAILVSIIPILSILIHGFILLEKLF